MFGQLWVECVADGAGVAAATLPESAELVLAVVDDVAPCDVAALATARLPPSPAPSATAPTPAVMMIRLSLVCTVTRLLAIDDRLTKENSAHCGFAEAMLCGRYANIVPAR
jgi:hypothetical protein